VSPEFFVKLKLGMQTKFSSVIKGVLCCVVFTAALALVSPLKNILPAQYERYSYGILGTIVAIAAVWLFSRIDKKQLAFYGFKWSATSLPNFFIGFLIGSLLTCLMIFIMLYVNDLSLKPVKDYDLLYFFVWGLSLLLLSYMEEIAFRTYPFVSIKNAAGPWVAQIIIATLFALYHMVGGQSITSVFMGPFVWAFIFGWAVLRTNGIAMATGIHFAANIWQAAFGQKSQYPSIFTIDLPANMGKNLQQQIDQTSMVIHLFLFIIAISLSFLISRKQ
jgi:membrane protease YdiL (CAAX protease family)